MLVDFNVEIRDIDGNPLLVNVSAPNRPHPNAPMAPVPLTLRHAAISALLTKDMRDEAVPQGIDATAAIEAITNAAMDRVRLAKKVQAATGPIEISDADASMILARIRYHYMHSPMVLDAAMTTLTPPAPDA